MIFIVVSTDGVLCVLKVDLSFVAQPVDVRGTRRPGDVCDAPFRFVVPPSDVQNFPGLTFPSCRRKMESTLYVQVGTYVQVIPLTLKRTMCFTNAILCRNTTLCILDFFKTH